MSHGSADPKQREKRATIAKIEEEEDFHIRAAQ